MPCLHAERYEIDKTLYSKDWMCSKWEDLHIYGEKLANLDFADEIVLMSEDAEGLQILTDDSK